MHVYPTVARNKRRQKHIDFQPFPRYQGMQRNEVNPFAANIFRDASYYLVSTEGPAELKRQLQRKSLELSTLDRRREPHE
jgi:hypothetical protein